ncbi:MAG: hydroxymethylglutaryl-CoA synthase [Candidatus Nitrosocaldaceae archaeon]
MKKVGIDDISIYVPPLYLDYKDFAEARHLDPAKLEHGLGVKQMAITDSDQDPACMAANACLRLLEKNDLKPSDIGRIYLATESSIDESKAMNSYVIGMLEQIYGDGSFSHCGGIECKFACVSGSYAIYDNTNWIRAMENDNKAAIVIVSDVAKYEMGSSGEYTQGAGALAMLIKEDPRIISFDPKVTSTVIRNEYDFYRPFARKTPIVNGQYSNLAYLIQVKKAMMEYERKSLESGLIKLGKDECVLDHIDLIAVHLPYAKMGKNALAYLLRHEWRNLSRWKEIISLIGMDEPKTTDNLGTIESILEDTEFMNKDKEFNKRFMETPHYKREFVNKLESSLIASSIIGNLYTGSLYMGFRSELEYEYKKGRDLAGLRVGFASYGSGASAMVFSGVISDEYKEVVKIMNLENEIGKRRRLSVEEYVHLHKDWRSIDEPIISKHNEFVLIKVGGSREGFREYIYSN